MALRADHRSPQARSDDHHAGAQESDPGATQGPGGLHSESRARIGSGQRTVLGRNASGCHERLGGRANGSRTDQSRCGNRKSHRQSGKARDSTSGFYERTGTCRSCFRADQSSCTSAASAVSPAKPAAGQTNTTAATADSQEGKSLFVSAGCVTCHMIEGKGGKVGPDLSHEAKLGRSNQWLIKQITDPTKHNPSTTMPAHKDLTQPQLKGLADFYSESFVQPGCGRCRHSGD